MTARSLKHREGKEERVCGALSENGTRNHFNTRASVGGTLGTD